MKGTEPTRVSRKQMEAQLVDRAWKDATFRRSLTENPVEAIERELGVQVPQGVNITVVEESPTAICLVIPVNPFVEEDQELTDDQLKAVSGGGKGGKADTKLSPRGLDPSERARIAADVFPFFS